MLTQAHLSFSPGYLSSGDSNAPGNYALLDITAGLHWVKENIGAFGGDPEKVCLFGHKHGAALVNLLLISPISNSGWWRGLVTGLFSVDALLVALFSWFLVFSYCWWVFGSLIPGCLFLLVGFKLKITLI